MAAQASARNRSRLPKPLTRFVGRDDEIETVIELLRRSDVRLLTLTGPGGIGKTRLSIEVANQFDADPEWSVHFVTLASVVSVEDAMPEIASVLGVWDTQKGDLINRTAQSLDQVQTLVVLDNLEHVVDVAIEVGALLLACPNLTIMVTSRIPLHIQGEREYSVPQLTLADPRTTESPEELLSRESIALFVDRAQAISQDFVLDAGNAQTIAQICARLDGLPLAIELAAARTKALPPAALLGRLDKQLRLLRTDARDVPPRLQAMRATIDWSYQLLEPDQRHAFRTLSVFTGDFSLDAAGAMLRMPEDEVIDAVASLIDGSLLVTRGHFDNSQYYRILAVLREFGLEQLEQVGEAEDAHLCHAEFVARTAEASYTGQFEASQALVFEALDRVHDNIRQALTWSISSERWDLAARIAAHLWQYWVVRGNFAEGRQWFERLLDQEHVYPSHLIPDLYFGFAYLAGTHEEVMRNAEMAVRLKEIGVTTGDRRIIATASILAGIRPWDTNGMRESLAAIDLWKELGEPIWTGRAASEVSRVARELGDIDMAEDYAHKAYDMLQNTTHLWGIALTTTGVGRILHMRGQTSDAMSMFKKALSLIAVTGDWILVFRVMEIIINIAGSQGQYISVVRLSAATSHMRKLIGYDVRSSFEQAGIDARLEQARSALGEDSFKAEWMTGQQLSLEEAIAEAMKIEAETTPALPDDATHNSLRLSRREREVLQQIVTGQTDQQIADELFVSYRTVTTHVTHILNKLGAGSRTEAAAIAVRDHLI